MFGRKLSLPKLWGIATFAVPCKLKVHCFIKPEISQLVLKILSWFWAYWKELKILSKESYFGERYH